MSGLNDFLNMGQSFGGMQQALNNPNSLGAFGNTLGQSAQRMLEQQAIQVFNNNWINEYSRTIRGMSQPGMSHIGTVKEFRRKFKEYTKAEFREISNKPVIKDILSGMTKLNKEQTKERIAEHLAVI